MRLLSSILMLLLLSSCTKTLTVPQLPVGSKNVVQHKSLAAFNQVFVKGNINVSLHTGYKLPQIILRGNSLDLIQVVTKVNHQKLIVYLNKAYPRYGNVSIEIRTNELNSFNYTGEGTITGKQIHSSRLDLAINNPGSTLLDGSIVLNKVHLGGGGFVQINGIRRGYLQLQLTENTRLRLAGIINIAKLKLNSGWLSVYWVKTGSLTISARGRSYIQLAGIANTLDVELWDRAHFNGRYFRANRLFAKTHDKSIADILAVKHQHTFATDASDIYFHKIPDTKADFMECEGSVLDMRGWDKYTVRDYDRYNK